MNDGSEAPPDPLIGAVLGGRYRVEKPLDAGSVAIVYRALDQETGSEVAVKVLRALYADTTELSARFDQEARVLSALTHPNIVGLLDYGLESGTPFLVLELLPGRTLQEELALGALAPSAAFDVARQILEAVAHAHDAGILHRDLKPANVFLQADEAGARVKILDFGLARLVNASGRRLTHFGQTVGTPAYVAPEQLATTAEADARSDVYAVGLMLFEMLAGKKLFAGAVHEQVRARMTEDPPRLSDVLPDASIPAPVDEMLEKALARSPDDRFQTASEFLGALAAVAR